MPRSIVVVVGTRPEAIKMAPVVKALSAASWASVKLVSSGQHRDLLDQALGEFGIKTDADLGVMREGQSLSELTARLVTELAQYFASNKPDFVLAQGDTTTVLATALVCFYNRIPFGHVEAGLRSGQIDDPFPEELNRQIATLCAALHFAPTEVARDNLLAEGVDPSKILVTGNTGIDALLSIAAASPKAGAARRTILLTAHRRENFGDRMTNIFRAVRRIAEAHDVRIVYPVHPNPQVWQKAHDTLGGLANIELSPPLGYSALVSILKDCDLVLTDSGGLQEEAPALGKPVIVLRDETERPEGVAMGVSALVGTDPDIIFSRVTELLTDRAAYDAMALGVSPYGDGHAAQRIVQALADYWGPN